MHPDGLWFSSATGGLQFTPEYHVPLCDPERLAAAFYVIGVIRQTVAQDVSERHEAEILKTQHIWVAVFL